MNVTCVPVGPIQANCFVVSDDHGLALAIDPGGEPERLAALVASRGLTLTQILITHGHFDHLVGAKELAEATGAQVACSEQAAESLRDPGKFILWPGFGNPPGMEPDRLLHDGDVLTVGDLTFEIGGQLFCGDLLFRRSVGRTDFPGGDMAMLLASVRALGDRFPGSTVVHPGHMDDTTLGEELAFNPFLVGLGGRG